MEVLVSAVLIRTTDHHMIRVPTRKRDKISLNTDILSKSCFFLKWSSFAPFQFSSDYSRRRRRRRRDDASPYHQIRREYKTMASTYAWAQDLAHGFAYHYCDCCLWKCCGVGHCRGDFGKYKHTLFISFSFFSFFLGGGPGIRLNISGAGMNGVCER